MIDATIDAGPQYRKVAKPNKAPHVFPRSSRRCHRWV